MSCFGRENGLGVCFECIWQTAWTGISADRGASTGEFLALSALGKLWSLGVTEIVLLSFLIVGEQLTFFVYLIIALKLFPPTR